MQIPSPENFSAEDDSSRAQRYWAPVPGTGYDLSVPGGEDWEPDAASLALAQRVLPALDALVDEAAAYIGRVADEELGLAGSRPGVTGVHCDARRERVEVSLNWEVQRYILWTVAFAWRADGSRTPVELSARAF
jgi:hypothetical protein